MISDLPINLQLSRKRVPPLVGTYSDVMVSDGVLGVNELEGI